MLLLNNRHRCQRHHPHHYYHYPFSDERLTFILLFAVLASFGVVLYCSYYRSSSPYDMLEGSFNSSTKEETNLETVLRNAAMKDKTVIITAINEAWSAPNSIFGLFLQSFRIGIQTQKLLNHLVVVAWDPKAYAHCLSLHRHCYAFTTKSMNFSGEAKYMTPEYLRIVWTKVDFLRSILDMGYNFIFTDADILWFRDPFFHFDINADYQISCDVFSGNSSDINNLQNTGFMYVKSNNRTIQFFKLWYNSRLQYPGLHTQAVFDKMKYDPLITMIGLQIRFLDTNYFGGFCEPSKDFNVVCTMHANCCVHLYNKVHDLRIMLEDWRHFKSVAAADKKALYAFSWRVPQHCG